MDGLDSQPSDLASLASAYWKAGDLANATLCCEQMVRLQPQNASALNSLALCQIAALEWSKAAENLRRSVLLEPESAPLRHNLASVLEQVGQEDAAAAEYRKSISLGQVNSLLNLADLQFRRANAHSAKDILRALKSRNRGDLSPKEKIEEAADLLRLLLDRDFQNAEAHSLFGLILQQLGRHQEAVQELATCLRLNPASSRSYWRYTRAKRIEESDRPIVEKGIALAGSQLSLEDQVLIHSALGKAFDDLGQYEAALQEFDLAHEASKLNSIPFDRSAYAGRMDAIKALYSEAFFRSHQGIGCESEKPVFVVGMPRSGTTLVEQLLSCHSNVFGAGEISYWPELAARAFLHDEPRIYHARRLATLYLAALERLGNGSRRVVDKNPYNSLHVGLLHMLFPRARIIWVTRRGADIALSIYMANFRFPPPYAHDRGDIVYAYQLNMDLLEHWKSVMPAGSFFSVRYEDLVLRQEETSRAIIDFCGLDWEDACLNPEKNDRLVSTASQWQVRQGVYQSSIDRWKRYKGSLGVFERLIEE